MPFALEGSAMYWTRTNWIFFLAFASALILVSGTPFLAQTGSDPVSITSSVTEGLAPLVVSFSGSAAQDISATYDWDFGDGSPHGTGQKVDHTFLKGGFYTVVLTVKDSSSGRVDTATALIRPWNPIRATASAAPVAGAAPLTVNFYGQVSGGKPPYRFFWDFGDRSTSSSVARDQNPTHIFARSGRYNVIFRVYDSTNDGAFDGSLEVTASGTGALGGRVGIRSEGAFYLLNGQGIVAAAVSAKNVATGSTTSANVTGGVYSFPTLPSGTYDLAATITYTDHIPFDADLLTYGCPGPSGGTVLKQVTSQPVRVTVSSSHFSQDVVFPPPIAFVHGAFDCYQKWYATDADPGLTRMWDNDARAFGVISFTPNYQWWMTPSTWPLRAEEVYEQLGQDLAGISSVSPPVIVVAHDMGGLVTRALTSGDHNSDDLIRQIRRIYLLGTPNSGSDLLMGGGTSNLMSGEAIVRRFNRTYPDFGSTEVYAIGGSKGEWGLTNTDGYVPLLSAFTVSRQVCSDDALGFPTCKNFPSQIFPNGDGHIFPYTHLELGTPASTTDILENTVLSWVFGLVSAQANLPVAAVGGPRSPVGATIWGTNTRTIRSGSKSLPPALGPESAAELDLPFQVSKTDGMLISAQVLDGSADFQVLGPSGSLLAGRTWLQFDSAQPDFHYNLVNPEPGNYVLRVIPGAQGVSYSATAVESGLFGVSGFVTQEVYSPGDPVLLRLDFDGLTPDVQPTDVSAEVSDAQGNPVVDVPLYDDGMHQDGQAGDGLYGGTTEAPAEEGPYSVTFSAKGTYQGTDFSRTALTSLYVVPASHIFLSGQFSDEPSDTDHNGSFDSLKFNVGLILQAGSTVVVSGDLYDSDGFFIAHAAAQATASGQTGDTAILTFSLKGITCAQFGAPFQVKNLTVEDPAALVPLDVWAGPVPTVSYTSSGFACLPGMPGPVPAVASPDQAVQGQTLSVYISGENFKKGAIVSSDSSLVFAGTKFFSDTLLFARLSIPALAAPGSHVVTVTNPDGTSGSAENAFTIIVNRPPSVSIFAPADGTVVSGSITVAARATDDVAVQSVTFLLDGVQVATVSSYPFRWTLDGASLASGAHTITARALDQGGLTADASVVVYKNPPILESYKRLTSPFRIKIRGANFETGCQVFIGTDAAPWSNVTVKSNRVLILKAGAALKAKFPKDAAVTILVKNPNGTQGKGTISLP